MTPALYRDKLYRTLECLGHAVQLQDPETSQVIEVDYGDPDLLVDPTDSAVDRAEGRVKNTLLTAREKEVNRRLDYRAELAREMDEDALREMGASALGG